MSENNVVDGRGRGAALQRLGHSLDEEHDQLDGHDGHHRLDGLEVRVFGRTPTDPTDPMEELRQLREAMVSRAPIEQAKGMLMLLRGYSADAAWAELRRASCEENVKLRDIARALCAFAGVPAEMAAGWDVSPAAAAVVDRRWADAVQAARGGPSVRGGCAARSQAGAMRPRRPEDAAG